MRRNEDERNIMLHISQSRAGVKISIINVKISIIESVFGCCVNICHQKIKVLNHIVANGIFGPSVS